MKRLIVVVCLLASAGCASHTLQVANEDSVPRAEVLDAVQEVNVGMSAEAMLSHLVPVANTLPCFKSMPYGIVRYYFELGDNSQMWVEIENPDNLLPLGPMTPNGTVKTVGRIGPKEKWTFKWEDSNELK